jgi:acyl-CoA reductase-like NAD-dependent aldehyde dehydrogenase
VHTPMGSISYALAAGNAVVFKPSEHTPAVAAWLTESFARTVPERPVLQLVTGRGETGAVLCRSGVDKIAFTGSAATARAVMATCASSLTPVVLECGGKDALIVAEDADLDLAAEQAVWGSMANAGQTCAGVERAYVAEPVFDAFLDRVTARAKQLEVGDDPPADYGAMTVAAQASVISRHIGSALAAGGRAVVGGPAAVRGNRVWPVVLVDVPEECTAMTEETFGPVLVVTKVADAREGVRRANASPYGLGAAVFSARHGNEIADRLDVGMVSINSVLAFAAIPGLPWGGSKESGFGRIHGPEGLREFARSKAVTDQRFTSPLRVMTFDREDRTLARLRGLVRLRWGHG